MMRAFRNRFFYGLRLEQSMRDERDRTLSISHLGKRVILRHVFDNVIGKTADVCCFSRFECYVSNVYVGNYVDVMSSPRRRRGSSQGDRKSLIMIEILKTDFSLCCQSIIGKFVATNLVKERD